MCHLPFALPGLRAWSRHRLGFTPRAIPLPVGRERVGVRASLSAICQPLPFAIHAPVRFASAGSPPIRASSILPFAVKCSHGSLAATPKLGGNCVTLPFVAYLPRRGALQVHHLASLVPSRLWGRFSGRHVSKKDGRSRGNLWNNPPGRLPDKQLEHKDCHRKEYWLVVEPRQRRCLLPPRLRLRAA